MESGDILQEGIEEAKMVRFFAKLIAGTLVAFIVTITGCTMHSNTFDKERMLAEAEQVKANAEYKKASNEVALEQMATIERLIKDGVDPIAAACAIKDQHKNDTTCVVASAKASTTN